MEWDKIVDFIEEVEQLKSTLRTAWTRNGRQESTAEHSWRLALFALTAMPEFPELNREQVLMLCLVHDLGELYSGDISAALNPNADQKFEEEARAMEKMCRVLPDAQAGTLKALWQEYEDGKTPEAQFVRALDKAETILQHSQGSNPEDFDYSFNLHYGEDLFTDPRMRKLRKILDRKTEQRKSEENV